MIRNVWHWDLVKRLQKMFVNIESTIIITVFYLGPIHKRCTRCTSGIRYVRTIAIFLDAVRSTGSHTWIYKTSLNFICIRIWKSTSVSPMLLCSVCIVAYFNLYVNLYMCDCMCVCILYACMYVCIYIVSVFEVVCCLCFCILLYSFTCVFLCIHFIRLYQHKYLWCLCLFVFWFV